MSFFEELKRRNVVRVSIAYVLISWLLLSVADFGLDLIDAPNWVIQTLFLIALIGLPVAMVVSWVYEMTPEGIKKESEVDRSTSITPQTGQKLNRVIVGLLALVAVYFIWESRFSARQEAPVDTAQIVTGQGNEQASPAAEPEPAAPINAIAVLPFAHRSNREDDLYFTDGIHDDLLTQLARLDGLEVISRTTAMSYRETDKSIPEIAAELGVGTILEGGVQRAGSRIRINAQLIEVATDKHLWADTFEEEMTVDNLFEIQSQITREIVRAVRGQITEEEQSVIAAQPTDNLGAWEAYLQARAFLRAPAYTPQKYQGAEPWAKRAVELDPDFAEAWAMLTEIQAQGVWMGYANTQEQIDLARSSLQRAQSLAPNNAAVMLAEADYLYRVENNYAAAERLQKQALQAQPNDAEIHHVLATTQRRLGLWDESIANFRLAMERDPANVFAAETMIETLAIMSEYTAVLNEIDPLIKRFPESDSLRAFKAEALMLSAGRLDDAGLVLQGLADSGSWVARDWTAALALFKRDYAAYRQTIQALDDSGVNVDIFTATDLYLGASHIYAGELETGTQYLRQFLQNRSGTQHQGDMAKAFHFSYLAEAHALLGENETALRLADLAEQHLNPDDDALFGNNIYRRVTQVRARSGQLEQALEMLETTVGQPSSFTKWWLYLHPAWDFLRDNPRFVALSTPDNLPPTAATPWKQTP